MQLIYTKLTGFITGIKNCICKTIRFLTQDDVSDKLGLTGRTMTIYVKNKKI